MRLRSHVDTASAWRVPRYNNTTVPFTDILLTHAPFLAAQLGLPEVKLGLLPGGGGCVRLPRLIGLTAALPLLLTGATVTARKALKLGLVDCIVPDVDQVLHVSRHVASCSP